MDFWKGELAVKPRLKSLKDQTIVIAGASSGIGLVTERMATKMVRRRLGLALVSRFCVALDTFVYVTEIDPALGLRPYACVSPSFVA
jgi:hypothetical protein